MKFVITIHINEGTVNAYAENRIAANVVISICQESPEVCRVELHEQVHRGGLVQRVDWIRS